MYKNEDGCALDTICQNMMQSDIQYKEVPVVDQKVGMCKPGMTRILVIATSSSLDSKEFGETNFSLNGMKLLLVASSTGSTYCGQMKW